jgi:hypothetical protein
MDSPHHHIRQIGQCWWDNIAERTQLARWLIDEGRIEATDTSAVLDVIEKPAKYTKEYTDMCAALTAERAVRLLGEAA